MNKSIAIVFAAVVSLSVAVGCEQTNVSSFDAEEFAAVNFATDSLSYSFLENSEDTYVEEVPVQLVGDSTNADREFEVEVVDDSMTTADPDDYEIQDGVVPAGQFSGTLLIELRNSEKLEDNQVSLHLRLVGSQNLEAGNIESNNVLIYWTDQVIVPDWTYYSVYFCPYPSTAAYRAIVESTGLTEFTLDDLVEIGPAGAEAMGRKFSDYVEEYNANNSEPLTHDDGPQEGQPVQPIY